MDTIKPMKMTDIPVTEAERYIQDENWVLEQKMDGARGLVAWNPFNGFQWQASGGGPLRFAAAVQHFKQIEADLLSLIEEHGITEVVFDGEIIVEDGLFHLFDIPYLHYADQEEPFITPPMKFVFRRNHLHRIVPATGRGAVRRVFSAYRPEDKRLLWAMIKETGVEGGMVKDLRAPYESGIRTKNQLKLKLVKTADVIVDEISNWTSTTGSAKLVVNILPEQDPAPYRHENGKRISYAEWSRLTHSDKPSEVRKAILFSHDPRTRLTIGNASLIGKDRGIQVGSVVEINYLYWTGDAVIQPRIMRLRLEEEKRAADCTIDQFPIYTRAAVSL